MRLEELSSDRLRHQLYVHLSQQTKLLNCFVYCCVCARSVTRSHPTLSNPMDCSMPCSLSMGFSRQEYWSGLPFPHPGHLPNPGIKSMSLALAGRFFYHRATREAQYTAIFPVKPQFLTHNRCSINICQWILRDHSLKSSISRLASS